MSTNASGSIATSSGPGFTQSEDLLLARAWVRASGDGTDQDASVFWQTVAEIFNNADCEERISPQRRTPQSVRCRWTLVQRVVQKYIAVRTVRNAIPSGTNPDEDEIREATMSTYQNLTKSSKVMGHTGWPRG
jgi:hypothetical protein